MRFIIFPPFLLLEEGREAVTSQVQAHPCLKRYTKVQEEDMCQTCIRPDGSSSKAWPKSIKGPFEGRKMVHDPKSPELIAPFQLSFNTMHFLL